MRRRPIVVVIAVLLLVAAAVNYPTLRSVAERVLQPETQQQVAGPVEFGLEETLPAVEPIGPANAPVKLEVFYEAENPCHGYVEPKARTLAERYAPHLQLQLRPWTAKGTSDRADEMAVHCLVAVSLVGPLDETPGPGSVEYTGPSDIGAWSWCEVESLVRLELASAGIEVEPKDLESDETAAGCPATGDA
jgi:hypothetical protein